MLKFSPFLNLKSGKSTRNKILPKKLVSSTTLSSPTIIIDSVPQQICLINTNDIQKASTSEQSKNQLKLEWENFFKKSKSIKRKIGVAAADEILTTSQRYNCILPNKRVFSGADIENNLKYDHNENKTKSKEIQRINVNNNLKSNLAKRVHEWLNDNSEALVDLV